jgi:hypothetical protein
MPSTIRLLLLALTCVVAISNGWATTAIALRSRNRIVLAADSRARYGVDRNAAECKLFEVHDVYATVSGLAHYGTSYRSTDAIRDGFSGPGNFESHVVATAFSLQRRVQKLLINLQRENPREYAHLMRSANPPLDFVQLALAQTVSGQPMLGIIELKRVAGEDAFRPTTTICPGSCPRSSGIFYFGYWERIKPYVSDAGRPRSIGSAASIDRLIRLEMEAHPGDVGGPINILEIKDSGARWLQNGGNCSLPGVGW